MEIIVEFPSGKKQAFNSGVKAEQILSDSEFNPVRDQIIAARVNNEIVSVSYKLEVSCTLFPILLDSREGVNIYRRSLCYLLAKACKKVFKERRLVIGHSLGKGYYYYFDGMEAVPKPDLNRLTKQMLEIVKQDLPIRRHGMSYAEAIRYFEKNNQPDTLLLIKNSNRPQIPVNTCGDFIDISHGPLVPSTGMLGTFRIKSYHPGFILRYPPLATPKHITPFEDNPLLFSIYKEYKHWGKILKINCIGLLNEKIKAGEIKEFISVAEALHNRKIVEIADIIQRKRSVLRLVLIAGPSSSGKTTFMKKLALQLKVFGITPVTVSIDDYFLPRKDTPKDKHGNYDFETLDAVNIKLLNEHITRLLRGEEVLVPHYDFTRGIPKKHGKKVRLEEDSILMFEGIHALNDLLTPRIPAEKKFRIYVSALTQLNLDDHNRIPTTDVRILRRIVRDHRFRGNTALTTFKMWPAVRNGEDKYIFPFQNNADIAFNSSLDYELAVLKVYAEPLLKTIEPSYIEYSEVQRLLVFLDNVIPIPSLWVPAQSILREFIGESDFSY
ncbi:MAG: nucleoside kinase [Spirochaetales bacterium]|nr:nucleoside kinase [Spirochaetales bacterium]